MPAGSKNIFSELQVWIMQQFTPSRFHLRARQTPAHCQVVSASRGTTTLPLLLLRSQQPWEYPLPSDEGWLWAAARDLLNAWFDCPLLAADESRDDDSLGRPVIDGPGGY
jgi:hypothetical protein